MFLAWRNLIHDRVRLAVTLTGIVFAIVLIVVQFGLFLGFQDTSANVIEHSGADVWISAKGTPHLNGGTPFPETKLYKVLATPGVASAQKYVVSFVNWKLPDGGQETGQIVGFDLETGLGGPWNVTQGSIADLHTADTVMVDELYAKKLGVSGLGHMTEINGRRARVVGFTRGIRSFTTAPYLFTSFKNSQDYARLAERETAFLLVKAAPGTTPLQLREALAQRLKDVDIHTNDEFLTKTRRYWVLETGAGITTLIGAFLGLVVGVVVVAQTIYAATVDHLREFGTLKAMGASNGFIYRVIINQALLSAVMGYSIAIVVSWLVARSSETGDAIILLPLEVAVGMFVIAVLMCTGASVISIRKATTIDPAMVFKG
ncbi:MAG TPA: ABC transporter permease [Bryobacteraceae bacterium]|nr:ABC transporter permease [Bryobacteraceae bacterium]